MRCPDPAADLSNRAPILGVVQVGVRLEWEIGVCRCISHFPISHFHFSGSSPLVFLVKFFPSNTPPRKRVSATRFQEIPPFRYIKRQALKFHLVNLSRYKSNSRQTMVFRYVGGIFLRTGLFSRLLKKLKAVKSTR